MRQELRELGVNAHRMARRYSIATLLNDEPQALCVAHDKLPGPSQFPQ